MFSYDFSILWETSFYSKIKRVRKTDKLGTNLYGLVKAGEQIGIELTGVEAESIENLKEVQLPIIAHVINKQGYDHFVIVENIKNNMLYIVDPNKGKYKLPASEFQNIWTNIVVLTEKMDTFSEQNESPSYYKVFTDIFKRTMEN